MDSQFEHAVHFRLKAFGEELLKLRKRIAALEAGQQREGLRLVDPTAEYNRAMLERDELADFAAGLVRAVRLTQQAVGFEGNSIKDVLAEVPDAVAQRLKEMK